MVLPLLAGAAALLGLGWFSSSLVASLAEPVSLIMAAVAASLIFIQVVRRGYLEGLMSTEEGEKLAAGILGGIGFFLVFVTAQSLITALSPLAGVIVVALVLSVFIAGPSILFDLLDVLFEGD